MLPFIFRYAVFSYFHAVHLYTVLGGSPKLQPFNKAWRLLERLTSVYLEVEGNYEDEDATKVCFEQLIFWTVEILFKWMKIMKWNLRND